MFDRDRRLEASPGDLAKTRRYPTSVSMDRSRREVPEGTACREAPVFPNLDFVTVVEARQLDRDVPRSSGIRDCVSLVIPSNSLVIPSNSPVIPSGSLVIPSEELTIPQASTGTSTGTGASASTRTSSSTSSSTSTSSTSASTPVLVRVPVPVAVSTGEMYYVSTSSFSSLPL